MCAASPQLWDSATIPGSVLAHLMYLMHSMEEDSLWGTLHGHAETTAVTTDAQEHVTRSQLILRSFAVSGHCVSCLPHSSSAGNKNVGGGKVVGYFHLRRRSPHTMSFEEWRTLYSAPGCSSDNHCAMSAALLVMTQSTPEVGTAHVCYTLFQRRASDMAALRTALPLPLAVESLSDTNARQYSELVHLHNRSTIARGVVGDATATGQPLPQPNGGAEARTQPLQKEQDSLQAHMEKAAVLWRNMSTQRKAIRELEDSILQLQSEKEALLRKRESTANGENGAVPLKCPQ